MNIGLSELLVDQRVLIADFADLSEDDGGVFDEEEITVTSPLARVFWRERQESVLGLKVEELDDFCQEIVGVKALFILFENEF